MADLIDPEKVVRDFLAGQFPSANVSTEVPDNLADVLPAIVVNVAFGRDGAFHTKPVVTVDVDYFDATRQAARTGAIAVKAAMHANLPGLVVTGGMAGDVSMNFHPIRTPWENPNVSRFTAGYTIQFHSH